jgi:hypothetical protein
MKKSLLAIVLAVATMPWTFAAQAAGQANPPAQSGSTASATKTKPKKHSKPAKKNVSKENTGSTGTTSAAKPVKK